MAGGRGRVVGLVLLILGPVLVAAYAGVNYAAIRTAVRGQIADPEWAGGRIDGGLTTVGADAWRITWWTAAFLGVIAVTALVIGLLLRAGTRGRTPLLVLSGVLVVPYGIGFLVALLVRLEALGGFYDQPGFTAAVPGWQPATVLLLVAAALAEAADLAMAAAAGRRALANERPAP